MIGIVQRFAAPHLLDAGSSVVGIGVDEPPAELVREHASDRRFSGACGPHQNQDHRRDLLSCRHRTMARR
jgi:hypothetical protein